MTERQFRELCSAIGIGVVALLVFSVSGFAVWALYQLAMLVVA